MSPSLIRRGCLMRVRILSLFLLLFVTMNAGASVVIGGTRVIYKQENRQKTVQLTNNNDYPVIVQSWIDTGDLNASPETINAPFVLTPPLFRMDPMAGQSLRISWNNTPLPEDRESIFWLNVLEIPPKSSATTSENQMQIAIRTRIKLIYRPKTLARPNELDKQLSFTVIKQDKGYAIKGKNRSPYYVSFRDLDVSVNGRKINLPPDTLAPFAEKTLDLPQGKALPSGNIKQINYNLINDWGGVETHTSML